MKKKFNIFGDQLGIHKKESKEYSNLSVLLQNSEYWWIKEETQLEIETLLQIRNYITKYLKQLNPNEIY